MPASREELLAQLTGPGGAFEVEERDVNGVEIRVFKNAPPSLRQILEAAAAFGKRDFLVYDDERITFAKHHRLVASLADHLRRAGVGKGDRVAVAMRNYPEWPIAFWATQVIGAVTVPLNAWWTSGELEYALRDCGAAAIVADGERLERIAAFLPELDLRATLVVRHDGPLPDGAERWEHVVTASGPATLPEVDIAPDDLSTILYTSGTTGNPKGAVGTHRNHLTNLTNTFLMGALNAGGLGLVPSADDEPPVPVSLLIFPFFHIAGLSAIYLYTAIGATVITMYKWDVDEAIRIVERERVSATAMVPSLLRELLTFPKLAEHDLSSLGALAAGGAPVPPDLIDKIGSTFDRRVAPGNGYGLTETTSAIISNGGDEYFAHPDSVGRPLPMADVRVVDESGTDVAPGEIGELWIRGANVVQGYWNKPEATAEAFTDGWFRTGDLGREVDGLYYVVDRLKDVVIRGGENVYCAEVEAVLFEHPDVADVAVFGRPHEFLGEEVAAVVNLKPGAAVTADDLRTLAAARLAKFKVPEHIILRNEPLPRTATGKVVKRDLRESFVP